LSAPDRPEATDEPSEPVVPSSVAELVDRVPEGWTPVTFEGRRYGLSRTTRAGGRSISVYAEELGGPDVISANVYLTSADDLLRPCEMPADQVLRFLRGWRGVGDGS
jgi:peptide-methionine (S)-S-oxide reductase